MIGAQSYRFGDVEVDLARGCVLNSGHERHLRQKAFQVLAFLLENRERLVSKDEIFENVWSGVAVTDDVLVQCVKEIRRAIGDEPRSPRFVKTVPKVGYRFIGDVADRPAASISTEVTSVEIEYEERITTTENSSSLAAAVFRVGRARYALAACVGVLVLAAIGFYVAGPGRWKARGASIRPGDGRTVVAVMPFDNPSANPELEWLREGLPDMIAAGLSRSDRLMPVDRGRLSEISRGTSAAPSLDASAEVAREAQADVLLRGSFSQIGGRLRLDVGVYDARDAQLLSAQSLTVDKLDDILSQIDLLSLKLANLINPTQTAAGPQLATVMTDNLEAYRYYSLGVEKANGFENKEAISLLEKAVQLDPQFAMAHARIGYTYALTWGQDDKGKPYLEKAFKLSSRLTERDRMNIAAWYTIANHDFDAAISAYRDIVTRFPLDAEAHWRLGRLLGSEERIDEAIDVLRQGLTVDPKSKNIYNTLGTLLAERGRHDEAIAAHQHYVALAPNAPNSYDSLGLTYQAMGDYANACLNYERAIEINPQFEVALIHYANARIQQGRYNAAIEIIGRYIASAPSDSERSRGYEILVEIALRKGDFAAAEKAAATGAKFGENTWITYDIATARHQTARQAELAKRLLAREPAELHERGHRAGMRLALYQLGRFEMLSGNIDGALDHFREALRHPPSSWHYTDLEDCLALALMQFGRTDEAIAEFQRILQQFPTYPMAHYNLAEAYRLKGMESEARDAYLAFLNDWKDADADIPEIIAAKAHVGRATDK